MSTNIPSEAQYEAREIAQAQREMAMVHGFDEDSASPVVKVKLEQSVNGIGRSGNWAPKMRTKSGNPERVAEYLANYINEIAGMFSPNFTHE